jgi:hypothetical protein
MLQDSQRKMTATRHRNDNQAAKMAKCRTLMGRGVVTPIKMAMFGFQLGQAEVRMGVRTGMFSRRVGDTGMFIPEVHRDEECPNH